MKSGTLGQYYPVPIGNVPSESRDFPADPVGSWEEIFFIPAGKLARTPWLPRRGADYVRAEEIGTTNNYRNPQMYVPGPNPDGPDYEIYRDITPQNNMRHVIGVGPGEGTTGTINSEEPNASVRTRELPVPPVFSIGLTDGSYNPLKAPAGGVWIRVCGMQAHIHGITA